jgi:hypothetical protein
MSWRRVLLGVDWVSAICIKTALHVCRITSIADVSVAIFLLDFVSDMDVPKSTISVQIFPKTFAWLARYRAAVDAAKSASPKPMKLDGQGAADRLHRSELIQANAGFDHSDPTGLKEEIEVEIYAADWGSEHKDRGRLVGLTSDEVTVAVKSKRHVEIQVHAPRNGFKIKEIGQS